MNPSLCTLKLEVDLALRAQQPAIEIYLAQYADELCSDLDLPVRVALAVRSVDGGEAARGGLYRVAVDGQPCRLRWWPQPVLRGNSPARDVATLIAAGLYDSRELLLSRDLADHIALEWRVSIGDADKQWSSDGFRAFLRTFLRYNHSLKHARRFVTTGKACAKTEQEAEYCFEQALEDPEPAAGQAFGPAVILCQKEYQELRPRYATEFQSLIRRLGRDLGLILPEVRIEAGLPDSGEFQIQFNAVRLPVNRGISSGELLLYANRADADKLGIAYCELLDPGAGSYSLGALDSRENREKLSGAGCGFWEQAHADYLSKSLEFAIRANAGSFLASPIVQLLLDRLNRDAPNLIENIRNKFGDAPPLHRRLAAVLRRLLAEEVPIGDLASILESCLSVSEVAEDGSPPRTYCFSDLTEPLEVADGKGIADLGAAELAVAARLGVRSLAFRYDPVKQRKQKLPILRLLPGVEAAASEDLRTKLLASIAVGVTWATLKTRSPRDLAVVVNHKCRARVRELLRAEFPTVAVVSTGEIPNELIAGLGVEAGGHIRPVDLEPDTFRERRALERHWEKAIPRLEEAISRTPSDLDADAALGVSYTAMGRFEEGRERLREAESLTITNTEARPTVSMAYYAAGRALASSALYPEALEMFSNAVRLDPEVPIYHYDLAQNLDELNQREEASKEYRLAARFSADDATWQATVAEVFYNRSAYEDAILLYRRAANLHSVNADYVNNLGNSLFGVAAYGKAAQAYRQAILLGPAIATYHDNLAYALTYQGDYVTDIALKQKRYSQAVDEYALALDIDATAARYYSSSRPLTRLRRFEQATEALHKALELDPTNGIMRRELAACLSRQARFAEAVQELETVIAFGSPEAEIPQIQQELAKAYVQAGEYGKAAVIAERLSTTERPEQQLLDLVTTLRSAKLVAEQLSADPKNPKLLAALAEHNVRMGNLEAAIAQYREAAKIEPAEPEYHKRLGNTLYKEGDLGGAASEWERVLALGPDKLTFNNLGTAYDGLGQVEKAIDCYKRALALPPPNFVAYYNLGSATYRLGRLEEAQDALEKAVKLNPDFAPSHYHLGNCYYRLAHPDQAMEQWKRAIDLSRGIFAEAHFNLGVAFWKTGGTDENRQKAIKSWEEALRSDRNLAAAEDNLEAARQGGAPDLTIFDVVRGR